MSSWKSHWILRDHFITHYFEENTDMLCPVLQTYRIKTTTNIFSGENNKDVTTENVDGTLLEYLFKLLPALDMSYLKRRKDKPLSFLIPCAIYKYFQKVSFEDKKIPKYFGRMKINLMCRQNAIVPDEMKILLNILARLILINSKQEACGHVVQRTKLFDKAH